MRKCTVRLDGEAVVTDGILRSDLRDERGR
jgi:hypothetical protein